MTVTTRPSRRHWSKWLPCLVVVGVGTLFCRGDRLGTVPSDRLAGTLGPLRVVEGRLPGFRYAPWSGGAAGPSALLVAWRFLDQRSDASVSASIAVTTAEAQLVFGNVDDAVAGLEGVPADRTSADTLATLSAAYLERARLHDDSI